MSDAGRTFERQRASRRPGAVSGLPDDPQRYPYLSDSAGVRSKEVRQRDGLGPARVERKLGEAPRSRSRERSPAEPAFRRTKRQRGALSTPHTVALL